METDLRLNSGHIMPLIGLGTWDLRGNICLSTVKFALENGYRAIDTATMYRNETEIGSALADFVANKQIERSEVYITTKIWSSDLGKVRAQSAVDQSLKELKLDYIDLHLIHWPGSSKKDRLETYEVLLKNKHGGKIKSIGVSNFSILQIEDVISEFGDIPSVNQYRMNPFDFDPILLKYCQDKGIVVTAYSPLTQAHKLKDPYLQSLSKKYNKSVAQILLRWGIQHNVSVIPKSSNQKRILENMDLFDFEIILEDMITLNALS